MILQITLISHGCFQHIYYGLIHSLCLAIGLRVVRWSSDSSDVTKLCMFEEIIIKLLLMIMTWWKTHCKEISLLQFSLSCSLWIKPVWTLWKDLSLQRGTDNPHLTCIDVENPYWWSQGVRMLMYSVLLVLSLCGAFFFWHTCATKCLIS